MFQFQNLFFPFSIRLGHLLFSIYLDLSPFSAKFKAQLKEGFMSTKMTLKKQ